MALGDKQANYVSSGSSFHEKKVGRTGVRLFFMPSHLAARDILD